MAVVTKECNCGLAFETSTFKEEDECKLCQMKDPERAKELSEVGFDPVSYKGRCLELSGEINRGTPVKEPIMEEDKPADKPEEMPNKAEMKGAILDALTDFPDGLSGPKLAKALGYHDRLFYDNAKWKKALRELKGEDKVLKINNAYHLGNPMEDKPKPETPPTKKEAKEAVEEVHKLKGKNTIIIEVGNITITIK